MSKIYLYFSVFLVACASIQPLDGGPKDVAPPKVLATTPDSAALRVTTDKITITFDEYIKAQKIRDLLILSPAQSKPVKTDIKGKTLIISLQDTLIANTTYSLQLNGSIVDNNEGNPLNDYALYFSTGDYIDSLYYSANIIDAYSKAACEECILSLYTSEEDSAVLQNKPIYIGKTNSSGNVIIPHLKPARYRAIALMDLNKNLLLNDEEAVSLYRSIEITDSMPTDTFYTSLFRSKERTKGKLLSLYPGVITIIPERPVPNTSILMLDSAARSYELSALQDTITTYVDATSQDTFNFHLFVDSSELRHRHISSNVPERFKIRAVRASKTDVLLRHKQLISRIDTSKILIFSDSNLLNFNSLILDKRQISIAIKSASVAEITLIVKDSALQDLNGAFNSKDTIKLKFAEIERSLLHLTINLQDSANHILYIEKDDKIYQRIDLKHSMDYKTDKLPGGTYRIRIIKDINGNGLWDPADILRNKPAEDVYLSEKIDLRPSWDKQLTINY